MKKLMLVGTICGLYFGIPLFSMGAGMDTSSDYGAAATLASLGDSAPQKSKFGCESFIKALITTGIAAKYGVSPEQIMDQGVSEAMSKIIFAITPQETALVLKATASDSEDTEDDGMVVDGDDSTENPSVESSKRRYTISNYHKQISGETIIASCRSCKATLRKSKSEKNPLSGQTIFLTRMEGRCKNFPACIVFHEAAKEYFRCPNLREDSTRCPYLLTSREDKFLKNHNKVHHPEVYELSKD